MCTRRALDETEWLRLKTITNYPEGKNNHSVSNQSLYWIFYVLLNSSAIISWSHNISTYCFFCRVSYLQYFLEGSLNCTLSRFAFNTWRRSKYNNNLKWWNIWRNIALECTDALNNICLIWRGSERIKNINNIYLTERSKKKKRNLLMWTFCREA